MLVSATVIVGLAAFTFEDIDVLLQASQAGILYFAAAGLVHYIAGWGFMNASTKLVGASRMSAITGITPLFAAILAILTLREILNVFIGSGIILIVIGTYFIARS
jgi:drug/metabolite transporter (DMT)-like permease